MKDRFRRRFDGDAGRSVSAFRFRAAADGAEVSGRIERTRRSGKAAGSRRRSHVSGYRRLLLLLLLLLFHLLLERNDRLRLRLDLLLLLFNVEDE